jgi:hypothetical protein
MATTSGTKPRSEGMFSGLFDAVVGITGETMKYDLQRRQLALKKAEAEKAERNSLAEIASNTADIVRNGAYLKYAKYIAAGVVGLVGVNLLFKFVNRQFRGA